ncbi:hypothetical protein PSAB6_10041 [Paraburkholderia sabiae]|nr:hypothetical protein PSAB6_10041 [Paraburkholderia sabiae]
MAVSQGWIVWNATLGAPITRFLKMLTLGTSQIHDAVWARGFTRQAILKMARMALLDALASRHVSPGANLGVRQLATVFRGLFIAAKRMRF